MRISCLVNNHNYRRFVGEAVDSALKQSHPFDEIVVVDDGSSDGSQEFLQQRFGHHPTFRLIAKEQAGQLSCFNHGIESITGDIVFFLDADDKYQPQYVESALQVYQTRPEVDFLTVHYNVLGKRPRRRMRRVTRDRGLSVIATILNRSWVGMPTSCLSMRTRVARQVLPYPFEPTWQTRADDVLIFGSSLVQAHKYHLHERLVDYRVHGNNYFANRKLSATEKLRYWLRVNQLINWFVQREGYDVAMLPFLLHREFRTWERPGFKEMLLYLRMSVSSRLPMGKRLEQMGAIVAHMISETRNRRPTEATDIVPTKHQPPQNRPAKAA